MKRNQSGFTLAELVIVLGLLGIVTPILMSFFILSFKDYRVINDKLELQFQAQYILNFMSNRILESKNIELARENTISHLKKSSEQNITKISFRYGTNVNQCYNFEIKNGKIRYGNARSDVSPTDELGLYIKKLTVTPITGKTIGDTDAISIKIILEKNQQTYAVEQYIYMRNYEIK